MIDFTNLGDANKEEICLKIQRSIHLSFSFVRFSLCIFNAVSLSAFSAIASEKKDISKELVIKGAEFESIFLNQDRRIVITATGEDPDGAVSEAEMQVMAMPDVVILSVKISLEKGQTQSWEVLPEKNPCNLSVSGKSGQTRLRIDQKP
jgi:hypothetical protein